MPRTNAYAMTLTKSVQERVLALLDVVEQSAGSDAGPNLRGSLVAIRLLLTKKKLHKGIK